jgi:hypothetical protein
MGLFFNNRSLTFVPEELYGRRTVIARLDLAEAREAA